MTGPLTDQVIRALMRVNIPQGEREGWYVDRFNVRADDPQLGVLVEGTGQHTALREASCSRVLTTWMSDVDEEIDAAVPFVRRAHGRVLVTGLGLGSILKPLSIHPAVTEVVVVEQEQAVIDLVWASYEGLPKLRLVHGNAFSVVFGPDPFDCVWHDIWPTIDALNVLDMLRLLDRFRATDFSMCWSAPGALETIRKAEAEGKTKAGIAAEARAALEARGCVLPNDHGGGA